MPARKATKRRNSRPNRSASQASPDPSLGAESINNSIEQGLSLWTQYARETGESVADFLRRFGEEQQKSYETWAANLPDALRPKLRPADARVAQERFDKWTHQAEEIGNRVREAFETTLKPQAELLELWTKPFLPADADGADQTREVLGLVQKFWSGLTGDLTRRMMDAMKPEKGFDEFVQAQEEATKQFTENFQKLVRVYFTSPAFVATFGKTLDSSLDLQKSIKDSDELFRRVTGLPTRREISELNLAVRDLSEQVSRIKERRP